MEIHKTVVAFGQTIFKASRSSLQLSVMMTFGPVDGDAP
jgi:hypothetical protein